MHAHNADTLEQLLAEDPLGKIYEAQRAAEDSFEADPRYSSYIRVMEAAQHVDRETQKKLIPLDENTEDGQLAMAKILDLSPGDVKTFAQLQAEIKDAIDNATDLTGLKQQWEDLLPHTSIRKITDPETFPVAQEKPFIVFYSADWCEPCHVTKPTFARLSFFFDKADLFYCPDEAVRAEKGIKFIPQLVAYFPNGARVWSYAYPSTKGLWEAMNNLITLGKGFTGHGALVCTETECSIKPEETPDEESEE